MNSIQVQSPGLLTTVQDLGRENFGSIGVSPSGAADAVSLRLGNRLVGNPPSAAALEMTLLGGAFLFSRDSVIALAGSDFSATLDNAPVPFWASLQVKSGQSLRVGPTRSGARCYLCIAGGLIVEPLLGSASTHLLSGLGGHHGRALRKGDVLQIGSPASAFRPAQIAPRALQQFSPRKQLRVTSGPQSELFPTTSRQLFYSSHYTVSEESNRMGLRLSGPAIPQHGPAEMITEGVPLGAIQVTAAGLPIILFVEQQTTGGYAKIANVISADFHSLGQLRPRDEINFVLVDWDTARALLLEQEQLLASPGLLMP